LPLGGILDDEHAMDKITVLCECGARLLAPADKQGKQAKCPKCGACVTIRETPPDLPTAQHSDVRQPAEETVPLPPKKSYRTALLIGAPLGCLVVLVAGILAVLLLWSAVPLGPAVNAARDAAAIVAARRKAIDSPSPILSAPVPKDSDSDPDLVITIESVKLGKVKVRSSMLSKSLDSADAFTAVQVTILNRSADKKVEYRGSKDGFRSHASLCDDLGNTYQAVDVGMEGAEGQIERESIYPGKSIRDLYVFQIAVPKAKRFALVIRGEAFDRKQPTILSADLSIPR